MCVCPVASCSGVGAPDPLLRLTSSLAAWSSRCKHANVRCDVHINSPYTLSDEPWRVEHTLASSRAPSVCVRPLPSFSLSLPPHLLLPLQDLPCSSHSFIEEAGVTALTSAADCVTLHDFLSLKYPSVLALSLPLTGPFCVAHTSTCLLVVARRYQHTSAHWCCLLQVNRSLRWLCSSFQSLRRQVMGS